MDLPAHQLTMTVPMTPDMADFAGNVHGGTVDHERRPGAVAALHPGTPDERQRHAAAEVRKQLRAEFAQCDAAWRSAAR